MLRSAWVPLLLLLAIPLPLLLVDPRSLVRMTGPEPTVISLLLLLLPRLGVLLLLPPWLCALLLLLLLLALRGLLLHRWRPLLLLLPLGLRL